MKKIISVGSFIILIVAAFFVTRSIHADTYGIPALNGCPTNKPLFDSVELGKKNSVSTSTAPGIRYYYSSVDILWHSCEFDESTLKTPSPSPTASSSPTTFSNTVTPSPKTSPSVSPSFTCNIADRKGDKGTIVIVQDKQAKANCDGAKVANGILQYYPFNTMTIKIVDGGDKVHCFDDETHAGIVACNDDVVATLGGQAGADIIVVDSSQAHGGANMWHGIAHVTGASLPEVTVHEMMHTPAAGGFADEYDYPPFATEANAVCNPPRDAVNLTSFKPKDHYASNDEALKDLLAHSVPWAQLGYITGSLIKDGKLGSPLVDTPTAQSPIGAYSGGICDSITPGWVPYQDGVMNGDDYIPPYEVDMIVRAMQTMNGTPIGTPGNGVGGTSPLDNVNFPKEACPKSLPDIHTYQYYGGKPIAPLTLHNDKLITQYFIYQGEKASAIKGTTVPILEITPPPKRTSPTFRGGVTTKVANELKKLKINTTITGYSYSYISIGNAYYGGILRPSGQYPIWCFQIGKK